MTNTATQRDTGTTRGDSSTGDERPTDADMKKLAELLSDEARKLLARLAERYDSALTLPDDQDPFDELVENKLAIQTVGALVQLTLLGRDLHEYLGPYRKGLDATTVPNLKPPADPEIAQEKKREQAEAVHEADAKAEEERRKRAAVIAADERDKARERPLADARVVEKARDNDRDNDRDKRR